MKLAVRKEAGIVPLGGFHYMLHPKPMRDEREAEIFRMMGHIIIDVKPHAGEALIKSALAALNHQIQVAYLTEQQIQKEREV